MNRTFLIIILTLGLIFQITAQEAQESATNWSLWLGSHYTSFNDYMPKVAEFDRGVDGITPELGFNLFHQKDKNNFGFKGWYYDPERMNLNLYGRVGNSLKASVSYKSFYRQTQLDYLANLIAIEAGDRTGTTTGGKQLTHEIINPDEDLGYKRQEIETNIEFKIPGLDNVKLFAAHRSILETGKEQITQTMHCSGCHVVSRPVDVDRSTHAFSGGFEADLDFIKLAYEGSIRNFKSNTDPYQAFYDTARHPKNPAAGYYAEFGSRVLFGGEDVTVAQYPETEKMTHKLTAKSNLGRGQILAQFINMTTKNKSIANESFDNNGNLIKYAGSLEYKGNSFNLKYSTPLFQKTKLIAAGYYGRYENEPIGIDQPDFRANRTGGDIDLDWMRYSILSRTDMKGSLKLIYQPSSRYRLSVLGGYNTRERDDYPYANAKDKTTKMKFEIGTRYKPVSEFIGNFTYALETIDNPFSTYENMFERPARGTLTNYTGAPHIYYYQRDDLRYGSMTNQPTMTHNVQLNLDYKATETLKLNGGINVRLGSNDDIPQLDYEQTTIQPKFGLTYSADENFTFYGNYSYLKHSQNGLAAVALMDG